MWTLLRPKTCPCQPPYQLRLAQPTHRRAHLRGRRLAAATQPLRDPTAALRQFLHELDLLEELAVDSPTLHSAASDGTEQLRCAFYPSALAA